MLARKILSQKVLQQITTYPFWSEVRQMALGLSGKAYLVGGKVYRTVMEIEHGIPANPEDADWDFLLIGTSNQNRQFEGWRQLRGPGTPKKDPGINLNQMLAAKSNAYSIMNKKIPKEQRLSRTFERDVVGTYSKVDLISLEDVQKLTSDTGKLNLDMYFRSVPLDIQAIAIELDGSDILGHGLDAVRNKQVRINNPTKLLKEGDINTYGQERATALGYPFVQDDLRLNCICESRTLVTAGCICGYMKARKTLNLS